MASQFPILYTPARTLRSVDPFLDLSRQMNRLMDNFFPGASSLMGVGASAITDSMPRIDVQEDNQQICITADLPGVSASDVDVRIDMDVITICGEKRTQSESNLDSYRVMERSYGSFHRSIPLPFPPNPQSVQAEYGQGVLTIRIPKQNQLEVSQRIPVRDTAEEGQNRPQLANENQIIDQNGRSSNQSETMSQEDQGIEQDRGGSPDTYGNRGVSH